MEKPFVAKKPIHKAPDHTDIEEEAANDIVYNSEQRPQRHGERADSMCNDQYEKVPQASDYQDEDDFKETEDDEMRISGNVDTIAEAIMAAIDAVDKEQQGNIKSIMIEIGLEG